MQVGLRGILVAWTVSAVAAVALVVVGWLVLDGPAWLRGLVLAGLVMSVALFAVTGTAFRRAVHVQKARRHVRRVRAGLIRDARLYDRQRREVVAENN